MTDKSLAETFFAQSDLNLTEAAQMVVEGLEGADYGELYQEASESESISKNKGKYESISVGNSSAGFGFRVGKDESVGYIYADADQFNRATLEDAIKQARVVLDGKPGHVGPIEGGSRCPVQLYQDENPISSMSLTEKIGKIDEIEQYVMGLDARIRNVSISYGAASKKVHIITADGQSLAENRPMASLTIRVMLTDDDGKSEIGHASIGGRVDCTEVFNEEAYKEAAEKALKIADELLIAEDAPAGAMDVVMAAGWPAVILHEAVGHGLEGDFNRKGISVYSGKIGQKVAADAVTIIDRGDLPGERGSFHFDDEGVAPQENVLVKDGVLMKYMQDRQNAHLMQEAPTGNGRRESYKHTPMPRMTSTYFAEGAYEPEDIIASVQDGLYIAEMSGGQVDITSGKFNMNATLAYRIRNGKICEPVKGATLVGDGLDVIQAIEMVGNDLKLEKAAGTCGKNGQGVPVGIGQPTVKISKSSGMTVGGVK